MGCGNINTHFRGIEAVRALASKTIVPVNDGDRPKATNAPQDAAYAVDSTLHLIAAAVFLVFGTSHVGFLLIRDVNHELHNSVFPFLSNQHLYLAAAAMELLACVMCIRGRGRMITNIGILTFIAGIAWYRWAFYYVGGQYCGCLGLLGKLLHVTKPQEKTIPVVALTVLFLTTAPWLVRTSGRLVGSTFARSLCVALMFMCHLSARAQQTITILGNVEVQDYNPRTGSPHLNQHSLSTFEVTLSGVQWQICVTNNVSPQWWARITFDGTNTYTLLPFAAALYPPFGPRRDANPTPSSKAAIAPSSRFVQTGTETYGISALWTTYTLQCDQDASRKAELVDIPLSGARHNLGAFGYKWILTPCAGGRFVRECVVVRDNALDLSDPMEFLRAEFIYPETLANYNMNVLALKDRKLTDSGYIKVRYRCKDLFRTNGLVVPQESLYEAFLSPVPPNSSTLPCRVIKVHATSFGMCDATESLIPKVQITTQVEDYRYKRTDGIRMFNYATYTLKPGDRWKSGSDPELLAQAADWMKHGRKLGHFANRSKVWTVWAVLLVLAAPLAFVWLNKKQHLKSN